MAQPAFSPIDCLPWWHAQFAPLGGSNRLKIKSGCRVSAGNINCKPETMRASAEAQMRQLRYWTKGRMPLAVYTLARYVSSEVGSGSPEDKVAVIEAALNRTHGTATTTGWYPDGDVNNLLLYRQSSRHPNYGWYGPIHDPSMGAPYGRWAATSADPGIDDILIADFVLNGGSANFTRGAITQVGAEVVSPKHTPGWVKRGLETNAKSGRYWVGPLPGVDHWRTFLYRQDKSIAPQSPRGQALIARAQSALSDPVRPDWSYLPVCRSLQMPAIAVAAVALAAGLGLAYAAATWVEPTWRGTKYHSLDTDPLLWARYNRLDPWKK